MHFVNDSPLQAGWCLGFQLDGRETVVVAIKGTYSLDPPADPQLAAEQVPLTKADEFTGEPGSSAPRYETDYSHRKLLCDVLVNGSAHAPGGKPAEVVTVGLHLGPIKKRFEVIGDRIWSRNIAGLAPSAPRRFVKLPISYDRAYGGVDVSAQKADVDSYVDNPVGVGYYPKSKGDKLIGKPLPNTQEIGRPAVDPKGAYRPMSFSPAGRNFKFRAQYVGTYDKKWLETRVPLLPLDFDYRYYQCAAEDQQMPYPVGGEPVVLENLTPAGVTRFQLPTRQVPVLFVPHQGQSKQVAAVIDTVLIEPDLGRFSLTWRAWLPLAKSIFEIERVIIGKTAQEFDIAKRRAAKPHYAGLGELAKGRPKSGGQ
jgi:hypothetical protein